MHWLWDRLLFGGGQTRCRHLDETEIDNDTRYIRHELQNIEMKIDPLQRLLLDMKKYFDRSRDDQPSHSQ